MNILEFAQTIKNWNAQTKEVTTTYTVTQADCSNFSAILGNHGSSAFTITLPPAANMNIGDEITVKQTGVAAVTVSAAAGYGLTSGPTNVVLAQGRSCKFVVVNKTVSGVLTHTWTFEYVSSVS
jgi:hypothetical protein